MHHEIAGDRHVGRRHLLALQVESGRIAFERAAIEHVQPQRLRRLRPRLHGVGATEAMSIPMAVTIA